MYCYSHPRLAVRKTDRGPAIRELVACLTKVGAIGVLAAEIHTCAREGSAMSVLEKARHESM
jgi:hypothetical protein